jgi:GlpG protein
MLGASGVVFAFILLSSITSLKDGSIPLTFILVAVMYIGQQVYQGIFIQDNIANLAHIIGGAVGAILGFAMNRRR